jgi:peptidoglycan/LPS O-acetylase OafA/YrhL
MLRTPFWSLAKVPEILVFFIAGVGINRFSHLWKSKGATSVAWAVFLISMLIHVYWKISDESFDPWPHFLLAGISAPLCALSLNFQWKPLIWIGGYSFSIYLYHSIVMRSFPWADGLLATPEMQIVWFAGALGVAILLPILIDFTVRGVPYARTLIVGRKPRSPGRIPQPAAEPPILPDSTGLHTVMRTAEKK